MNRGIASQFRRAGVDPLPAATPFTQRWYGRILLLLGGVALLTAAFAPVGQFYLAWIGLVPWFLVLHGTRSYWSAFFWSWIAGTLFFIANMWWMAAVTAPGMVGLMVLLGLYWGYAGIIIRGGRLLAVLNPSAQLPGNGVGPPSMMDRLRRWPLARIVLLAAVWVAAAEWFRGTWPWHGLPWLYLGHTQSPALPLCQIADLAGVAGISFLIVMANAWIALWILNRLAVRGLRSSGIAVGLIIAATLGYGLFRMHNERLTPGPRVAVIQPNYPQDNSGQKGATAEEMLRFHFSTSQSVLAAHPKTDLVVWSETMMPPINAEARQGLMRTTLGPLLSTAMEGVMDLAATHHVGVLTGGEYWADFHDFGDQILARDRRNVAYFFHRDGTLSDQRYDKIHLVPFGEFTPFREDFPPLYRLIVHFGPPDMQYYFLQPGSEKNLTVFHLQRPSGGEPWRLVTPICFEDIDAKLCARMFRPDPGSPDRKRADVLVNLTNDGWFLANENYQHLQAAIFRSIENRVPTARSVNTGISGFIDPLGHTLGLVPARTAGSSVHTVMLCSRVSFFTRWGPVFSYACLAATLLTIMAALASWIAARFTGQSSNEIAPANG